MTVKPVEAAGLVLIRQGTAGAAEVLLGRRHGGARFMPGVYVFPGGTTSPADQRPSGFHEALAPPPDGLDGISRRRLAVFARTALRETFEETGLLLGTPGASPEDPARSETSKPAVWAAFARAGLNPAFGSLRLVARAITPARSPIRFHTRFFLAGGGAAHGAIGGDGELEDLHWVPVAAVTSLPMAQVTALVLSEALAHHAAGAARERPAALFRWVGPRMRPRFRPAAAGLDSAARTAIFPAPPAEHRAIGTGPWPSRRRN